MRVRAWLVTTFGRPWPLSAQELLLYLEERHEIQPMGKTVPTGVQGALMLFFLKMWARFRWARGFRKIVSVREGLSRTLLLDKRHTSRRCHERISGL